MQIDTHIPLPNGSSIKRYPFNSMKVGDSVFVENQTTKGIAYSAARMHGCRKNKKFTARAVDGGVRIWRIM